MTDTILSAHSLSCRFGGMLAVDDVSFDVESGSSVGIIGPNGAGKTTLFNLISGFVRPTNGTVFFRGKTLASKRAHWIARTGIGRTFQTVRVFDELSVLDNLAVADFLASVPGAGHFPERAREVLDFVAMPHFAGHHAGDLSYGQKKLVELAMVLINRPAIILLDEPVAGVNPVLIQQISDVLRRLQAQGLTLVIVEHNVPFVTDICDTVIVMANGQKLVEGTGAEVQEDKRVLEAFLGG